MKNLAEKLQEQLNLAIEYDFSDVYLTIPVEEGKRLLELMSGKDGMHVPSRLIRPSANPEQRSYY